MEVVLQTLVANLMRVAHLGSRPSMAVLAYIDPSTGSLIFQVVAASAISAGLFVKGLRERIRWLVTGGWRSTPPADSAPASTTAENAPNKEATESHRKAA